LIPPSGPTVNSGLDSAGRMQTRQEQDQGLALQALRDSGSAEVTYDRALALIESKGLTANAAAGALAHLAVQGHVRVRSVGRGAATFVEITPAPRRVATATTPQAPAAAAPEEPPLPVPPPSLMPQGVLLARDAYRVWLLGQVLRYPAERCAEALAVALRLAELPERGVVSSAGLRLTFEHRHLVGIEGDARVAIQAAERHLRPVYKGPLPPCGCDHPEPRWCRGCGAAATPLTAITFHKGPPCPCLAHPKNHQPAKGLR
jgi:hypothetical protein